MIVHLNGSARDQKDLLYLTRLTQIIHATGAALARDWVEVAKNRKEKKLRDEDVDWTEIVEDDIDAINRSDLVIIEASSYTFNQGYQTAMALKNKKTTLIISRNDIKSRMLTGVKSKFLTTKVYKNEEELTKIVNKFIKDNTISTKDLRFNFFIDRQIYNYLRDVSYETGKNKSEIIRELLEKEINRKRD